MDETRTEFLNLGHATAYAYAKSKGYTGTEEEFAQLCADLGIEVAHLEDMTVVVNMLEPNADPTATYVDGTLTLNIPRGTKGDTGKSAYEHAVDGGYTGTEAEFEQLCADLGIEVGHLENMTVVVNMVAAGTQPSATYVDGTLTLNLQSATDAQVKTAADAWLQENVAQETGYALDRSLSLQNAAAPADLVGDLRSALDNIAIPYNVLDYTKASDNTAISSVNGSASSNSSYWVTDFIEVQSETYIVSNYNIYKICYYDATKAFISATNTIDGKYAILENAKYVRVQFSKAAVAFDTSDAYILFSSVTTIVNPVKRAKKSNNLFLGVNINDFDFATKETILGLISPLALSWETGTINGTSGQDSAGSSRFRCIGYLPIDAFYKYENSLNLNTRVFAYAEDFSYLGATGNGMAGTYYSRQDIITSYPLCKYVRFVFQTDTLTDVTNYTTIYGSESYYNSVKAYDIGMSVIKPSGYAYSGERITINRNRLTYEEYDLITGYGQDAVVYDNYAFLFKADKVLIRRLSTKTNITSPDLPVSAHCNSAVFGNKYSENDLFPLIYVNDYNASGAANGVCYVFRITVNGSGVPNGLTLVQTITVGFANTEPWTDGNDARPFGNFFVDTIGGFLWAYTLRDSDKKTRFFKFALPDISNPTITIQSTDIIEYFDVQYMPYIQGNTFNDGKLYVVSGYGTVTYPGMLNVINLTTRTITTQINLYNIGLQFEPEFIDIIEGSIVLGRTTAYKFEF